jgi:PAS domain S-box-containing protein
MVFYDTVVGNLFRHAHIPCIVLHSDSLLIESVNQSFKLAAGLSDDVITYSLNDFFSTSNSDHQLVTSIRQAEDSATCIVLNEVSVDLQQGGERKVFNINIIPFTDETGKRMVLLLLIDITSYLREKNDAETRDADFRKMILDAPVAMAILSGENFMIETANTAILELWGRSSEVIGKELHIALPELQSQPFLDILKNVRISGEAFYGYEFLASLLRNGVLEDCYFNFIYSPVRESYGKTPKVMVIAYEVTQQVRSKLELEISEKKFRNLVSE